jgi:hypothetical protein
LIFSFHGITPSLSPDLNEDRGSCPMMLKPGLKLQGCVVAFMLLCVWRATNSTHSVREAIAPAAATGFEAFSDCRGCHQEHHDAWAASAHARASSGGLFPTGYAAEPEPICLTCHSPEEQDPDKALTGGGVTCVTCHVRSGRITTSRSAGRLPAPHPVVFDPALSNGQVCARCHQFRFKEMPLGQDTLREWTLATGEKRRSCTECHMSSQGSGRTHRMPGCRDAGFLARGIPMEVRVVDGPNQMVEIVWILGPVAAGHRVPTGDPFRQLALSWQVESGGRILTNGEEILSRGRQLGAANLREAARYDRDNRLFPGEVRTIRRHVLQPGTGAEELTIRATASLRFIPRELTRVPNFPQDQKECVFWSKMLKYRPRTAKP